MRPLRSLLTIAAATVALVGAASGPASAAPPVGCYGFPSIPDAFVCVVQFTPENAVPGASVDPDDSSVTIPEFCVGDCYGPFVVPVAGVDLTPSGGPVLVLVYKGQTYVVGDGEVPPPDASECVGEHAVVLVCYTAGLQHETWSVYACVAGRCELVDVSSGGDGLWRFLEDPIGSLCREPLIC